MGMESRLSRHELSEMLCDAFAFYCSRPPAGSLDRMVEEMESSQDPGATAQRLAEDALDPQEDEPYADWDF